MFGQITDTYTVYISSKGEVLKHDANGDLHCSDGPAKIDLGGSKTWYRHGVIHRIDGPAIEYAHGSKVWYVDGKTHREDGPAITTTTGKEYWYLDNIQITYQEFLKRTL